MVTGSLTGKMGVRPILPVRLSVTIATMLNFDGHCDGDGDGVGMCKQALSALSFSLKETKKCVFVGKVVLDIWIISCDCLSTENYKVICHWPVVQTFDTKIS